MKISRVFFFSILFFVPSIVLCEIVDRIAVVVNDEIITLSEIKKSVLVEQYGKYVSINEYFASRKIREKLNPFIEDLLIRQQARKLKIEVQDRDIEKVIENIKKQNLITEEELKDQLKKENISYRDFREGIRTKLLRSRVLAQVIASDLFITESKLKEYYEKNQEEFRDIELKLKQIFISHGKDGGQDKARAALEKLKAATAFDDVAITFSDNPQGFDLGYVKLKDLMPEIREALKGLEEGMHTDIVITPYGFHIIKVEEIKKGQFLPFETVKEEVQEKMIRTESERRYKEYIEKLKRESYIEVKI